MAPSFGIPGAKVKIEVNEVTIVGNNGMDVYVNATEPTVREVNDYLKRYFGKGDTSEETKITSTGVNDLFELRGGSLKPLKEITLCSRPKVKEIK
jgi:hypothetical protein